MKAELKGMHSPDADLAGPLSVDALLVQLMIGPAGEPGAESFDLVVRTPRGDGVDTEALGFRPDERGLVLDRIDAAAIARFVCEYLQELERPTWEELAAEIGRLARWEFQDYRPAGAGE
ncbi:Imm8 family immunity protein [Nocardia sp. X0981]